MEENQKRQVEEDEIDLVEVAKTIWSNRKIIYKTVAVFFVIGLLVALLSPVEYESETILLPEVQDEGISAGMAGGLLKQFGGLAGLAGLGSAEMGVMSPQLYPQILKSTPFLLHVMEQPVYFANEDTTVTVYHYFDEVKSPSVFGLIAGYTIGLPGKIKKAFSKDEDEEMVKGEDGKIKLTKKQQEIAEALTDRIEVELDDETGTIGLSAKMPDAEAAASIATLAKNYLTAASASINSFLMQFQSDILGVPVEVPKVAETTALGAAYLAGLATGFWTSRDELAKKWQLSRRYAPSMNDDTRSRLHGRWLKAVERAKGWAVDDD